MNLPKALPGLVRTSLAIGALTALAAGTLVSGAERVARSEPASWVAHLPPRNTGTQVAQALASGVPVRAIAALRQALAQYPMQRQIIGKLGTQLQMSGDAEGAFAAFSLGKALGWRDAPTQLYWYGLAAANADWAVAIPHLDALLRTNPALAGNPRLLGMALAEPSGRQLLAKHLAARPDWTASFLQSAETNTPEDLVLRTDVMRAAPRGTWSCETASMFVNTLLTHKLPAQARQAWARSCPPFGSLLFDGDLRYALASDRIEQAIYQRGFNWQILTSGNVDASRVVDEGSNRKSIRIAVSGATSAQTLRQYTTLSPGSYRLSWSMPVAAGNANPPEVSASLSCRASRAEAVPGTVDPTMPGRLTADLHVTADCPIQMLIIWVSAGGDVQLSDFALRPL